MPKALRSHAIVSIGGEIIVIGGHFVGGETALYKLSCYDSNCKWTTLPQKLKFARSSMVAMAIPDDFFNCKWIATPIYETTNWILSFKSFLIEIKKLKFEKRIKYDSQTKT